MNIQRTFQTLNRHTILCGRHRLQLHINQKCLLSQRPAPEKKGFFGNLIENIKQDIAKNKEMKESIKKFREEAQKLEESDALKKAREKFDAIESETSKGSQQIKEQLDMIKEKLNKTIEEAQKSELGKKGFEITEELAKQAKSAAEAIAKQSESLGQHTAFKAVSHGVKAIKEEVDDATIYGSRTVYRPPAKLRKRKELTLHTAAEERDIKPNEEATGVELHKDSRWHQSWQNFRENNQYVNKIFDWKMKFDESDNPLVRASRVVTDKMSELLGGLFQKTEMSEVLTEICKMDPNFDKNQFIKECEMDIIPNILEAAIRGDLEILKDWCHEAVYNALSTPVLQAKALGYHFDSRILDLQNVDIAMGKMMDQGPVLVITFQTQQIMSVKDAKDKVIEGDPNKIIRMHYVWVLCRDQTELDPKAAWKLIDMSASSTTQWV
ncbi:mitochondrial import inner membrane translocase: subunit TIM44-like protein [Leptotrombidium deliense]|uniref:Mitochondrial import inner membrane translocase subunit TIM44 n=1 Tax=Leptotrombidium deliense TaxID=299467 RepID=A0A443SD14_9ACAR|nr:mitochondrial import inner membrane translocase: subunit TIM44-like protein [Leptotrombidium deliense]